MEAAMKTLPLLAGLLVTLPVLAQTPDPARDTNQAAAAQAEARKPDPKEVAQKVQQALRDSDVPSQDIIVSTHAETVLLSGKTDSKADAARAVATAEAVAGEVRVAGQIEVREAPATAQKTTTPLQGIEAALKQDNQTANLGILLSVDANQVIGLHGLVPSAQSRAAAEKVAKRAAGTQRVRNYLVIPGE
jgi:osmotically-inducible protein OsmY